MRPARACLLRTSDGLACLLRTSDGLACLRRTSDGLACLLRTSDGLVSTGALITGLSNEEVASFLVAHLDPALMDGAVFVDADGHKMALVRGNATAVPLSECTVPVERRFTFYDQINTTGMDIKQRTSAAALVTIGKDMVYRDLAQGGYRMRGIGAGQTLELLPGPGVRRMMEEELWGLYQAEGAQHTPVLVVAWLLLRTFRAEETQYRQLCVQNIEMLRRRAALEALLASCGAYMRGPEGVPMQQQCATLFVQADTDGNGVLDKTEVLVMFDAVFERLHTQRQVAKANAMEVAAVAQATRTAMTSTRPHAASSKAPLPSTVGGAPGEKVSSGADSKVGEREAALTFEAPSRDTLLKLFDACDVEGRSALNSSEWQAFVRSALHPPKASAPVTVQGVGRFRDGRYAGHLCACLEALVVDDTERVRVPTTVMTRPVLSVELRASLNAHAPIVDDAGRAVCEAILQRLEALEGSGGEGSGDRGALDQEMSREREKDVVKEKERELTVQNVYERLFEHQTPWPLTLLSDASSAANPATAMSDGQFYPLRDFSPRPAALTVKAHEAGCIVQRSVLAVPPLLAFPQSLLQSSNVIPQVTRGGKGSLRRLRRVVFVVEVLRPASGHAVDDGAMAMGAAGDGMARCWLIVSLAEAAAIRALAHARCSERLDPVALALLHVSSDTVLDATLEYRKRVQELAAQGEAHVAASGGVSQLLHFYNGDVDLAPAAHAVQSQVLPGQMPALALLAHMGRDSSREKRRVYLQALHLARPRRTERTLPGTAMQLALELESAEQLHALCTAITTLRTALHAKLQTPREFAAEVDADGNRKLSVAELLPPLRQIIGPSVDRALVDCLVRLMDTDGSGRVDFDEWDTFVGGAPAVDEL